MTAPIAFLVSPKFWVIRTDFDEKEGCAEPIISAFKCTASEFKDGDFSMTLVQADHIQVLLQGELWEVCELPDVSSIGIEPKPSV